MEKSLKTTWKQRVFVLFIAITMLGSTIAVYMMIVLNGNREASTKEQNSAELATLQANLEAKRVEIDAATKKLSNKYLPILVSYKSRVKSYNAATANTSGLKTTDLKAGTGIEISDDTDYYAYYIGWCADESVFDSSFGDFSSAKSLKDPISARLGLIAGWTEGMKGAKLDGVRELSIPGELAYGETREICGSKNSPLKFIVLSIDPGAEYRKLSNEYSNISYQIRALTSKSYR